MLTIYGFSCYGTEPVEPISAFATVLHLPDSEEIWPGEWVILFPQLFATQHNDGCGVYLRRGSVEEHMRYEWLRMAKGAHFLEGRHDWLYQQHLAFHRMVLDEFDSPEKLPQTQYDYQSFDVEPQALDESMIVPLRPHRPVGLTISLGKSPTEQEDN